MAGSSPSFGEVVVTHEGVGEVTAIMQHVFVVKLDAGGDVWMMLELYEPKPGKPQFARCAWDCGFESHSMKCFLRRGHGGSHVFKAMPPARSGLFG